MPAEAASLERFVTAQREIYARVCDELRGGLKRSHWMWFIFPQIAGLGHSPMAQRYGIADLPETEAYLRHPVLAPRLAECTDLMLAWAGTRSAEAVLGPIDAMKLRSSMTLFAAAGGGARFERVIDLFFAGQRDERTLAILGEIAV